MRQMPLFSAESEAQRTLREEYTWLAAAHDKLFDQHMALQQEHRTLKAERDKWFSAVQTLQRLQAATDQRGELLRLRRDLAAAEDHITFLSGLLRARPGPTTSPAPTLEPLLKKLLFISHPDRWAQGTAADLANELSVAINRLREEVTR